MEVKYMTTTITFVDPKKEPVVLNGSEDDPAEFYLVEGRYEPVTDYGEYASVSTAFRETRFLEEGSPPLTTEDLGYKHIRAIRFQRKER
jgi:hypothetical protein